RFVIKKSRFKRILNRCHTYKSLKLLYRSTKRGVISFVGYCKKTFQENSHSLQDCILSNVKVKIQRVCLPEKVVRKEPTVVSTTYQKECLQNVYLQHLTR